jgi:hypothetical protein
MDKISWVGVAAGAQEGEGKKDGLHSLIIKKRVVSAHHDGDIWSEEQTDNPSDDQSKNGNESEYYFNNGYHNHDEKYDNEKDNQGEDVVQPSNFPDS